MPTPKSGTVTEDLAKAVTEVKGGRVEFKVDKTANLHVQVGKASFTQEQLVENASAAVSAVFKAKPDAVKGSYVLSASVAATMSPSVKLDVKELAKLA
jgi:large subunit ribosomal protein L1